MRRYVCPNCGAGKNAPDRARKNDVRRYCLPCSESTGLLVERMVPARETEKRKRAELKRERRDAARERRLASLLVVCKDARGDTHVVDLWAETHRALREMGYKTNVNVDAQRKRGFGHAFAEPTLYPHPRIFYSVPLEGETASYEWMLETIYHEAAHVAHAAPNGIAFGDREWHGPKYRKVLRDALQARWPFLSYGGVNDGRVYDADSRIVDQLKHYVEGGGEL